MATQSNGRQINTNSTADRSGGWVTMGRFYRTGCEVKCFFFGFFFGTLWVKCELLVSCIPMSCIPKPSCGATYRPADSATWAGERRVKWGRAWWPQMRISTQSQLR
jgi:hypothetical protein